MSELRRYRFHFVGTQDTFETGMVPERYEALVNSDVNYRMANFWGDGKTPTVTVNMDNVTFVEEVKG